MKRLHLITCVGVDSDLAYLPHFLAHYSALGVWPGNIHVLLQSIHADSPGFALAENLLKEWKAGPGKRWIAAYTSRTMWEQRRILQTEIAGQDDFVLSADVDEFHEYPASLAEIVNWCRDEDYDIVQGPFIDRIAEDRTLRPVPDISTPLKTAFSLQTELRHAIAGQTEHVNFGGSVKVMLCRGDVLPGVGGHGVLPEFGSRSYALGGHLAKYPGLHDLAEWFALPFLVHHYKWTADLEARMRKRLETPGVTEAGREYGQTLLRFFSKPDSIASVDLTFRDPKRHAPEDWKRRVDEIREAFAVKQRRHPLKRLGRHIRSLMKSA